MWRMFYSYKFSLVAVLVATRMVEVIHAASSAVRVSRLLLGSQHPAVREATRMTPMVSEHQLGSQFVSSGMISSDSSTRKQVEV
jgi:hypothetical protein